MGTAWSRLAKIFYGSIEIFAALCRTCTTCPYAALALSTRLQRAALRLIRAHSGNSHVPFIIRATVSSQNRDTNDYSLLSDIEHACTNLLNEFLKALDP